MGSEQSSSNNRKREQESGGTGRVNHTFNSADVKRLLEQQRKLYEERCAEMLKNREGSQFAKQQPVPSLERNRAPYSYSQHDLQNAREYSSVNNNLYPNLNNNISSTSAGRPSTSNIHINSPGYIRPNATDFVFVNKNGFERAPPSAPQRERSISRSRNTGNGEENFRCPTCRNFFGLYIYNCPNGHSACKECKLRNVPCSICRQYLTDRRNITLEGIVSERKLPCTNKDDGCSLFLKLGEMESHLRECPFNEMACPLNTITPGFCPYWRGKLNQLFIHFGSMHPNQQAEEGKEMFLSNISSETKSVFLFCKGNYKFLFCLWVSATDRMIYMATQLIGTKFSAQKWTYEIQIYSKREPRKKYQYSDICSSASESIHHMFKEFRCAVLPLSYAINFVNDGGIYYKFNIENTFKGRNNFQRGRGRGGRRL